MATAKIKRIISITHQDDAPPFTYGFHTVLFEIVGPPSKKQALMVATIFDDPNRCYSIYNVSTLRKMKHPKPWVNLDIFSALLAAIRISQSAGAIT